MVIKATMLSAVVLALIGQVLSPAAAQEFEQIFRDEQSRIQMRQQRCRSDYKSAQFAGLRVKDKRYKVDVESSAVLAIINNVWGCDYPSFQHATLGRIERENDPMVEYLLKVEGDDLVLYRRARVVGANVERKVIGVRLP